MLTSVLDQNRSRGTKFDSKNGPTQTNFASNFGPRQANNYGPMHAPLLFWHARACFVAQRCKELHSNPRRSRTRISRLEGTSSRRPACISRKDTIRRMQLQTTRESFVARQQDSLFARGNYSTRRLYGASMARR